MSECVSEVQAEQAVSVKAKKKLKINLEKKANPTAACFSTNKQKARAQPSQNMFHRLPTIAFVRQILVIFERKSRENLKSEKRVK